MPQNAFDKASRFLAKLGGADFVSWLLDEPPGALAFRGWLDTRNIPLPANPDRTSDTIARVDNLRTHGTPWAVAIEFQIEPDPVMFSRLLAYIAAVSESYKPDTERGSRFKIGAAVVNLTGNGNASQVMEWPEAGLTTILGVRERNLEHERADELLGTIESGQWSRCLLPWIPLMLGGDDPKVAERWKRAAELEPDRRRRSELAWPTLVFAEAAKRHAFWKEQLKEWNVRESTVANELIAQVIAEDSPKWIAAGKAEGKAEGIVEGIVEALRATVLRSGTKKFGRGPTETQRAALVATTDSARLSELTDRLFDVASWEELFSDV